MAMTRALAAAATSTLLIAMLAGCSAGGGMTCKEAKAVLDSRIATSSASLSSINSRMSGAEGADLSDSGNISKAFGDTSDQLNRTVDALNDLASASSGDIADQARDASKATAVSAQDFSDLEGAYKSHDRDKAIAVTTSMGDHLRATASAFAGIESALVGGTCE